MSKRNDHKSRARRLDALAKSEANIHERLIGLRTEFDLISKMLDRVTLTQHPRITVGGLSASHGLTNNLLAFRPRRGQS
jgi:hypothetical protein